MEISGAVYPAATQNNAAQCSMPQGTAAPLWLPECICLVSHTHLLYVRPVWQVLKLVAGHPGEDVAGQPEQADAVGLIPADQGHKVTAGHKTHHNELHWQVLVGTEMHEHHTIAAGT